MMYPEDEKSPNSETNLMAANPGRDWKSRLELWMTTPKFQERNFKASSFWFGALFYFAISILSLKNISKDIQDDKKLPK